MKILEIGEKLEGKNYPYQKAGIEYYLKNFNS